MHIVERDGEYVVSLQQDYNDDVDFGRNIIVAKRAEENGYWNHHADSIPRRQATERTSSSFATSSVCVAICITTT